MLFNQYEVRVLIKGRPITEYTHNGQVFIEGRDGSNFEIEFKNLTPNRVEAVLSVDGLSIIDGKDAGPLSSGYVVGPHETIRIPGWKLTDEQVAAFQFAGKRGSYAAQSTGSSRNTGVIGAMVFSEKHKPSYVPVHHQYTQVMRGAGWPIPMQVGGGMTFGMAPMGMNHISTSMGDVAMTASASASNTFSTKSMSPGVSYQETDASHVAPVEQTLGTAFGEATSFGTTEITFNRGDLSALIVMYYDDSKGLRARGIELTRPSKRHLSTANAPQAFPAMQKGCTPPPNWKG